METQTATPIQMSQKFRLRILTILVLLSIFAVLGFGWISFENRQTASTLEIGSLTVNKSTLEAQLAEQQANLAGKSAQLEDTSAEITRLHETISTLTDQINNNLATQTAQQSEIERLSATAAQYQAASQEVLAKLSRMETEVTCSNSGYFKADYTNNATLSKSIKTFIGDIGGNLTYASYDLPWPGSKNSIHRVTVVQDQRSFTNIFMAYFDEKDFSTKGVFWVNRSCWLDRNF